MATSSLYPVIKMEQLELTPNMEVNCDFETIFYDAKVNIKDYFERIHNAATELELQLLAELEKFAATHRDMVSEVDRNIEIINDILCSVTSVTDSPHSQLHRTLNNDINIFNKMKYTGIHITVEEQLSEFIGNSISIDIEVASDSNLEKILSSNPHPVMHYSERKEMISLETLHTQFSEIKTLLSVPKYFESDKMWYLIGRKWVEKWLKLIYNEPEDGLIPIPPPIDNSDIMDETESHGLRYHCKYRAIDLHKNVENKKGEGIILEELVMGRDFVVFNEAAWGKLVGWYGIKEDSLIFSRPKNNPAYYKNSISLILYPNYSLRKFQYHTSEEIREIKFFRHDTELEKLAAVKRVLAIPPNSEIIMYQQRADGTRKDPITNLQYNVCNISTIIEDYNVRSVYLVAVECAELEWLYV